MIVAGICKSIMDTLQFRYDSSIFSKMSEKKQNWFNPKLSWKNKYKNRDPEQGPAFPGSTTFLVWTTDAWHFFQMIMLTSLQIACVLPIALVVNKYVFLYTIAMLILSKLIFGVAFELFWDDLLKKK